MINYNRLGYEIKRDLTNFSEKIFKGLKVPKQKFVHQMIYGVLSGNKPHLSEIARSLKEKTSLKKTIDRLSRNLNSFNDGEKIKRNYLSLIKSYIKDDYAVIVIDNSDIAKPGSKKLEALSDIRDGSTGEITKGYMTMEAAVLSRTGKMPMPVYEKVFSAAEKGFISETHENLCCLEFLSENFTAKCVRALDRGFDANDYYKHFLKNDERFIIRAKKNRNVIYNGKTRGIMDVASEYKGCYSLNFKGKKGKIINCKMSCIPVRLCELPKKELTLVVVYGFGKEPMLLLSNLKTEERKRLCHIVTKVYLMRWRIEEYFKFKKQQFNLEDLRVKSLKSIRNLNMFITLAAGYIAYISEARRDSVFIMELKECAKRIYKIPKFIFYTLEYAISHVIPINRKGINELFPKKVKSQQLSLFDYFKIGTCEELAS